MKKRIMYTFFGLIMIAGSAVGQQNSNDVLLDEIVAIVNNGVILRSELAAETQFLTLQAEASQQTLPNNAELQERVLERLINQEIQRQRARELGIEIDQPSINNAIERVASGFNLDTFEFRNALEQQGFNYNYYRSSIKHELLLSRLIQRDVEQNINISDQEIEDFLSSTSNPSSENRVYRLSHILIAEDSSSSAKLDQARAKARDIVTKLNAGEDFAALARRESDGRMALNGGDLGWRKLTELPQFLHDAVNTTPEGEISNPVQSPDGFHVIKIQGIKVDEPQTTTETRVRHIFISDKSENYADGESALIKARQRLQAGELFADLAQEISEDPNSSAEGGLLQWFTPGDLPRDMESVANQLDKGEISQPFRTRFGWHLMEVVDRRKASINNEKQRQSAELSLRQRRIEQESTRWSRRLRNEAFVEIKPSATSN